ncbi:hypothetical protein XELAEV_18005957mg [Xenopus laevis]|uniref:L1 transposable element RRM domain-containing protein n=1 Tax=Xenopus laevis TaxID=8355 RepID=A0A974DXZ4_XENLA|nr:hypothetical protein XELAEV_18005957mg [Xenopus laevis]
MGKHGKLKDSTSENSKTPRASEAQRSLKQFFTSADLEAASHKSKMALRRPRSPVEDLPTKRDFEHLVSQIKKTVREEVADLKLEMATLHSRSQSAQNKLLYSLQKRIDDLDNRGRCCNLRIRGLPEQVDGVSLQATAMKIFNHILEQPDTMEFERIHRALRPKGLPTDKPRDVICCLTRFPETHLIILQDLSWSTLQHRRLLRPLITALKENNLLFRWGYPFSLHVTHNGQSFVLTGPDDLAPFLAGLGLSDVNLPDWIKFCYLPKMPLLRLGNRGPRRLHPRNSVRRPKPPRPKINHQRDEYI